MTKEDVHEGIQVCPKCGSEEIEYIYKEWRKVNGDAYAGYTEGEEVYWCPGCQTHPVETINYNEYELKQQQDDTSR